MERPKLLEEMLSRMVAAEVGELRQKARAMLTKLEGGDCVCLLRKSLYGLKQSGRRWHARLDEVLRGSGLLPSHADSCIYKEDKGETLALIYVDDILVAYRDDQKLAALKESLGNEFQVTDLGEAEFCLGIEIAQLPSPRGTEVRLSQRGYIRELLARFGMTDCKSAPIPLATGTKLPGGAGDDEPAGDFPYREIVGGLMYLAVGTRPDISFAVSHLSQFLSNPGRAHWTSAKRVLRFLKGTIDRSLVYVKSGRALQGFVDADWGGCAVDRRSYTGFVFTLAGGSISWESRKQRTVALSSTEAEYMALTEAVKESIYLSQFLQELGLPRFGGVTLFCDSQGAGRLARNPVFHSRSKHIDIKYHFVRQSIQQHRIDLRYIRTEEMVADGMTKILCGPKFSFCSREMGLSSPGEE